MPEVARPDVHGIEDPFAAFDTAGGIGLVTDVYPRLAELRAQAPVHEGSLSDLLGVPALGDDLHPERPNYAAVSYDAVATMLRDHETFSSAGYAEVTDAVFGKVIVAMDEPEHRRHRALLQPAFGREAVERWRAERTEPIVRRLVEAIADRGHADLIEDLTFRFPVMVIADVLGLPADDLRWFHTRAVEVILLFSDLDRGIRGADALRGYFADIVADRRREMAHGVDHDDVIGELMRAEVDGERLRDEDLVGFLLLLLPAGAETTYRGSSNMFFALLTHPEQLDAVRADRTLVPAAVEETLRWECTPTAIRRTTTRATELAGVPIPEGAVVAASLAGANHDETRWDDPDDFDVTRPPHPHLAFATGVHMCLGMHLARMEMAVALEAVLGRLPGVGLDPDAERPTITGASFRTPTALPVVLG